jgi:hypothetical protein
LLNVEFIISVAHDVVKQVAPEELPSFPAISAAYRRNPGGLHRQLASKDDDLGFGAGEVITAVASTILLVVQQVLVQVSSDITEKGAGTLFHRLGKKIFKRPSSKKRTNQPDSPEYLLEDVKIYAYKTARRFKIGEDRANQIARALVEELRTRWAEIEKMQ